MARLRNTCWECFGKHPEVGIHHYGEDCSHGTSRQEPDGAAAVPACRSAGRARELWMPSFPQNPFPDPFIPEEQLSSGN